MKLWRTLTVLLLLLGLAACSDDDEGDSTGALELTDDAPSCDEVFAEGESIDESDTEEPCDDNGELMYAGTAETDCDDGRVLLWNDYAWGYKGEQWHPHEAGAEQVAPEAERTACTG